MKNKLSVFTWSFRKSYYLLRPWKWIHELYWNCRNFIHRGRYGFAYVDIWGMDEYLLMLIPDMLRYLAKHSHGYPGAEPFETPEKYEAFLLRLAEKFDVCYNGLENFDDKGNKYFHDFMEISKIDKADRTEEQQQVIQNYFDESQRLWEENDERILAAYKELAEHHSILWD